MRPHSSEARQTMNEHTATGHTLSFSFLELLKSEDNNTDPYCVLLKDMTKQCHAMLIYKKIIVSLVLEM